MNLLWSTAFETYNVSKAVLLSNLISYKISYTVACYLVRMWMYRCVH